MTMTMIEEPEVDGRLGVVVAELSGEVLRLRQRLDALSDHHAAFVAALAEEVRTRRVVVAANDMQVDIRPGYVDVECRRSTDDPDGGSYVHLCAATHAAAVTVASNADEFDNLAAETLVSVYAGSEDLPPRATIEVNAAGNQDALKVEIEPERAAEWHHHATAGLWATTGDGSDENKGDRIGKAAVELTTGDDAFTLLEHNSSLSPDGFTLTDRGSLDMFQQQWRRGVNDEPTAGGVRIVSVDQRGVTEQDPTERVIAYSPLVRVVPT